MKDPTLTAKEVSQKASEYADFLILRLNKINAQYPEAVLYNKNKNFSNKSLSGPDQWRAIFEALCCSYIATQYSIDPD